MVLVNGELIAPKQLKYVEDLDGFGFWRLKDSSVVIAQEDLNGATLDLVVEEMGRMNGGKYNQYNQSFKGLWQGMIETYRKLGFNRVFLIGDVKINEEKITDWQIIPLDLKKQWVNSLEGWEEFTEGLTGPAVYSATLTLDIEPLDTFVDIKGWGKGMGWCNYNISALLIYFFCIRNHFC